MMLTPKTFECDRTCGDCCKYSTVKLSKKDISEIKKAGYKEDLFTEFDSYINYPVLKRGEKGCIFLGKMGAKYFCKIYPIRPQVCKQYPFVSCHEVESCKPALFKNRQIHIIF